MSIARNFIPTKGLLYTVYKIPVIVVQTSDIDQDDHQSTIVKLCDLSENQLKFSKIGKSYSLFNFRLLLNSLVFPVNQPVDL